MNKINRLRKEINGLEIQKQQAEELIKQINDQKEKAYDEIALAYQEFYKNKRNREFILYERFPSIESLETYLYRTSHIHPLYEYGYFNVKELAEVIKYIYQFHTSKEYKILTIGAIDEFGDRDSFSTIPHLLYMIGNDKSIEQYQDFNGKFINNDRFYSRMWLDKYKRNLIEIELKLDYGNPLNIECLTGKCDNRNSINYYRREYNSYTSCGFGINKQVFGDNIRSNLNCSKVKGIKDVFDLGIHYMESYIARVLMSIIIYKKNNNITELTEEDYNHIFDTLYGEKPQIKEDIEKDFGKRLAYVPNECYGR